MLVGDMRDWPSCRPMDLNVILAPEIQLPRVSTNRERDKGNSYLITALFMMSELSVLSNQFGRPLSGGGFR